MIAAMSPEDSWVCKWQRISKFSENRTVFLPFDLCECGLLDEHHHVVM
jgi:hypothetical protein